ncbi:MAG: RNA polymerase sigma-54 factor [Rhodospirillaceae bacterium]|nr:RNA polymerase sigma-54 factor [Rhodospirillaceae bacterium]
MALSQRLDLRQSQSLVMTPQLQQAIKLLQFSSAELREFVENELQQNPMLERDESSGDNKGSEDRAPEKPETSSQNSTTLEMHEGAGTPDSLEHVTGEAASSEGESPLDIDHSAIWEGDGPNDGPESSTDTSGLDQNIGLDRFNSGAGGRPDFTAPISDLEATLSGTKTLRDHLTEQLQVDIVDAGDRLIGRHLIESLDQSGWISNPLTEIAEFLGCPKERVEKILLILQKFDPPGVFARDLRECLALQLKDQNRFDPAMATLLENLDLLARQDKSALIKICGVDEEDLTQMVTEIRALDPKPAECFEQEILQTVTPDIFMRPHPDGGWIVELNSETLPRVLVNTDYYARITKEARNKDEKEYISEHFQSANWLVKSLHQRATTILKVSREIVLQQHSFFLNGVEHLKPLILRDIAEAIEMHESTVSRVTSNKYIHTPRGTFELKYFFTSAIGGTGGGQSHSAESVRYRIKSLIDEELPNAILSDDGIVAILKGDGVDIARRTVAKYREALKIPSSVQRRREKNKQL